jgi:hypothetical protein
MTHQKLQDCLPGAGMNTFPVLLGALCIYALAYRYYSAFIAAKVLALDDRRITPAHTFEIALAVTTSFLINMDKARLCVDHGRAHVLCGSDHAERRRALHQEHLLAARFFGD